VQTARFAPSTTGPAHPGTLLAALLCWLDARSRGARLLLRLEDLDPERCRPEWGAAICAALAWLGLDWDETVTQSSRAEHHAGALDRLAAAGRLYPCRCTRSGLRASAQPPADGGASYPGTCRERPLPRAGWRAAREPLRARLPEGRIAIADESGLDLSGDPSREPGDPVVRRRDAAVAYHLAGVVDDAGAGVTRVVRGRDLAVTTATQVALQRLLGIPAPRYRHHLLLLEQRGEKLAKLHGAVGFESLRAVYTGPALCGLLARAAGLRPAADPVTPLQLLGEFDWQRVRSADRLLHWTGRELTLSSD
jgi:glutamyl-tRNA synthetase/glutamyl-Q tRNA(Asp) synthetase